MLGSKGVFKSLGIHQPKFDGSTTWYSLPRFSVSNFSEVMVPVPSRLAENEIALQDGLVVRMDDLKENKLHAGQVAQIFSRPENIDPLRLTTQSMNNPAMFQGWVVMQKANEEDPLWMPRETKGRPGFSNA